MANNAGLDVFVAGVLLEDVAGPSNAGLDNFVAGVLYDTIESNPAVTTPLSLSGTQAQVGSLGAVLTVGTLTANQAQVGSLGVVPSSQFIPGSLSMQFVGV